LKVKGQGQRQEGIIENLNPGAKDFCGEEKKKEPWEKVKGRGSMGLTDKKPNKCCQTRVKKDFEEEKKPDAPSGKTRKSSGGKESAKRRGLSCTGNSS